MIQPRVVRMKDAPQYLGMDEKVFNKIARPHLIEISIGDSLRARGIGFDRLDLDAWWELHKASNGRPGGTGEIILCDGNHRQASINEVVSGISEKPFTAEISVKVPNVKTLKRQKNSYGKLHRKSNCQTPEQNDLKETLMMQYKNI